MDNTEKHKSKIGRMVRNQFVTGLLVIVPLGATILILVWLFNSIDHILQPVIQTVWHHHIPGVGFAVTVVLIYLAGVVATNVVGRRIIKWADSMLDKVPVFRLVYRSIRQVINSFSVPGNTFMQVVLVEFPQKGQKAMGFITNEMEDKDGKKLYSVLIPTAPNPTTGFMEILKEEDVIRTNIPVDEAVKMIVSVGKVLPDEVRTKMR